MTSDDREWLELARNPSPVIVLDLDGTIPITSTPQDHLDHGLVLLVVVPSSRIAAFLEVLGPEVPVEARCR